MDLKKLHVKSKFLVTKDELTVDADELKEVAGSTTEDIQKVIQADKDIISQIKVEYDETNDETILTFPKGIYPIAFYNLVDDTSCYLNYIQHLVVDDSNVDIAEIVIFNTQIKIKFSGEYTSEDIDELMYINVTSYDESIALNWYKILNPQSGTKLYLHSIHVTGVDNNNVSREFIIKIYSTVRSPFTTFDTLSNNIVSFKNAEDIEQGEGFICNSCSKTSSSFQFSGFSGDGAFIQFVIDTQNITAFTDIVTEL